MEHDRGRSDLVRGRNELLVLYLSGHPDQDGYAAFFCECGYPPCRESVTISMRDFDLIRAIPERYLVSASHVSSPRTFRRPHFGLADFETGTDNYRLSALRRRRRPLARA
jgi:hypothetical protein